MAEEATLATGTMFAQYVVRLLHTTAGADRPQVRELRLSQLRDRSSDTFLDAGYHVGKVVPDAVDARRGGARLEDFLSENLAEAAALWDELADLECGTGESARLFLMQRLAARLNAHNVGWVAGVRTAIQATDPLRGWRIAAIAYLRPETHNEEIVREMRSRWARREVDPFNVSGVEGAGTHRAKTLRRSMKAAWFDGDYYRVFYAGRDIYDSLWVSTPVTEDAESFFIFHRNEAVGAFGDREVALASLVLRGVKWLHRRWMLEHGLLVASHPLSPAERRVLRELLSEAHEAEIARRLELTPATVHEYVKSVFRKFGVSSRPGLMSLWLNRPAPRVGTGGNDPETVSATPS